MRKPVFADAKAKAQIIYAGSTISQRFKPLASSVDAQPGLCWTWSEPPVTGFPTSRLYYSEHVSGTLIKQNIYLCIFLFNWRIDIKRHGV